MAWEKSFAKGQRSVVYTFRLSGFPPLNAFFMNSGATNVVAR